MELGVVREIEGRPEDPLEDLLKRIALILLIRSYFVVSGFLERRVVSVRRRVPTLFRCVPFGCDLVSGIFDRSQRL